MIAPSICSCIPSLLKWQIITPATSHHFGMIRTLTRCISLRASITNGRVTSTVSFNGAIAPTTMAPSTTHGCRISVPYVIRSTSTIIFTDVPAFISSFFNNISDNGIAISELEAVDFNSASASASILTIKICTASTSKR